MKAVLEEVKPRALMIVLFNGERLLGFRVDRFLTVINQNPSASFFKFRIPSQFQKEES